MNALLLALLLSQNTPRHPSPATASAVPVGNGTNWVSTALPNCNGTNSALTFNTGPQTFGCNSITVDGGVAGITTISTQSPLSSVSDGGGGYDISITSPLPVANGGTALSSAGDDKVLIGSNATTYVATNIPDTVASGEAMNYNGSTNSFQSFAVSFTWSTLCLGALSTCATSSAPMGGILFASPGPVHLQSAACNTAGVGTAVSTGNATVKVYNNTNATVLGSCTISCSAITSQTGGSCSLSGSNLSATKNYSVYVEGCTSGTNVQCTIIGKSAQ